MKCEDFRVAVRSGEESPELLSHLRLCDECMNFAGSEDSDFFFRAIGGDEMVPPGGLDEFVGEVMHQVRLSDRQKQIGRFQRPSMAYGWSLAAAAAITVMSVSLAHRAQRLPDFTTPASSIAHKNPAPIVPAALQNVQVIEEYENSSATIVEMPEQDTNGVKVVMIFDDSLPVDL